MKSAEYARAILILCLVGCGARTPLDVSDEYPTSAGGRALQGDGGGDAAEAGAAGSLMQGHGGSAPLAGAGGSSMSHGGNAPLAGAGGSAGSGANGGVPSRGGAGGAPPAGGAAGASAGFGGAAACMNPGPERCDGIDNDGNGVVDDGNVCPCETRTLGNRSYLFCRTVDAWDEARAFCVGHGYHLATIRDETVDHWLEQTVAALANARWWIGLNDLGEQGNFAWLDGSPVFYDNFGVNEPNNAGGNEHCVELNRFGVDGGWNDQRCDRALPFVCESEPH